MVLGSCKKFLAESSQDQIRPSTTEELASLMYSDAYPYNQPTDNFDLLTDDIQNNGLASVNNVQLATFIAPLAAGRPLFTFDPTMFDANNIINTGSNLYQVYYLKIKGCNVIIDYLDKVNGSVQAKNAILGQCLFLRSYYYLKLATQYGRPYSGLGVDPETSLGVPLILSSQVRDGGIARASLKQTYDQIEKDLIQAAQLLKVNYAPTSAYRAGALAVNALLCRFYLYRNLDGDLDKVIQYANLVLAERSSLTPLSSLLNASNAASGTGIFDAANTEVLWVHATNPFNDASLRAYFPLVDSRGTPPYTPSTELSNLYAQGPSTTNYGDLRYLMYFSKYTSSTPFIYFTTKNTTNGVGGTKGLRLSEVYLNRAEAYIKRFIKTGADADRIQALSDLNLLRSFRYDTRNTSYVPIVLTDGAALFTFYQQERRRELALEDGHRWEDIKRFGRSVTHIYKNADGVSSTYVLAANSPLYALPIPYTALSVNPDLVQNPR
jgi:hypothetical protein